MTTKAPNPRTDEHFPRDMGGQGEEERLPPAIETSPAYKKGWHIEGTYWAAWIGRSMALVMAVAGAMTPISSRLSIIMLALFVWSVAELAAIARSLVLIVRTMREREAREARPLVEFISSDEIDERRLLELLRLQLRAHEAGEWEVHGRVKAMIRILIDDMAGAGPDSGEPEVQGGGATMEREL